MCLQLLAVLFYFLPYLIPYINLYFENREKEKSQYFNRYLIKRHKISTLIKI